MTEPMKPKVEQLIEVVKVAGDLAARGADAAVVPGAVGIRGAVGGVGGAGAGAAIGFALAGPPGAAIGFGLGILFGAIGGGTSAGVAVQWAKKRLTGG